MRIVWLLSAVSALYFEISERDKKCFIEELPEDTQMTGKYLVQLFDKQTKVCFTTEEFVLIIVFSYQEWKETAPGFGMHVDVTDPRDKAVLSRAYGAQGRVREEPIYLKLNHNSVYFYVSSPRRAQNLSGRKLYQLVLLWSTPSSS